MPKVLGKFPLSGSHSANNSTSDPFSELIIRLTALSSIYYSAMLSKTNILAKLKVKHFEKFCSIIANGQDFSALYAGLKKKNPPVHPQL